MTCQEVRDLEKRTVGQATLSELAAAVRHLEECEDCIRYAQLRWNDYTAAERHACAQAGPAIAIQMALADDPEMP